MTPEKNSLLALIELVSKKAPEYYDLLCADTEANFEKVFDSFIATAVDHLESNKKNFESLDEVGLSGVFSGVLKMPGLTVTQESHSNGHVDITIYADHCTPIRKKLCEAKIYSGPSYHIKGLTQLLDRYTTGREGRGIVLTYVKNKHIAKLVEGVREVMDEKLPCYQIGPTVNHTLKWSFLSAHEHSCGETLHVAHVNCNLHNE